VVRVATLITNGVAVASRYDLASWRGTVSIVPDQLRDGEAILHFVRERPSGAETSVAA
jgi:hypothetical protein